jgi:hypothetical protein
MEKTENMRIRIIESFSSNRCPLCALLRRDEFDNLCHWVVLSVESTKDSDATPTLKNYLDPKIDLVIEEIRRLCEILERRQK